MEKENATLLNSDLESLINRSILAHLPKALIESLKAQMNIQEYQVHDLVQREQPEDRFYIVVSGEVGLFRHGNVLGSVSKGRTIELQCTLKSPGAWNFEWKALSNVTVASFPSGPFLDQLKLMPQLSTYLTRVTTSRALQRLNHDLQLIEFTTDDRQKTLAGMIEISDQDQFLNHFTTNSLFVVEEGFVDFRTAVDVIRLKSPAIAFFKPFKSEDVHFSPGTKGWLLSQKSWEKLVGPVSVKTAEKIFQLSLDRSTEDFDLTDEETGSFDLNASNQVGLSEETEDDGRPEIDIFLKPSKLNEKKSQKFPFVPQHDLMDCGAACLAMVLRYHGKKVSIARLRDSLNISTAGTSLIDIERAGPEYYLDVLSVEGTLEDLSEVNLPFIALAEHHFVVMYKIEAETLKIGDPAVGLIDLPRAEFEKTYSGVSLLLKPKPDFSKLTENAHGGLKYFSLLIGHQKDLTRLFLLSLTSFFLALIAPLSLQVLFDEVLPSGDRDFVGLFFLGLIGISIFKVIVDISFDYFMVHLATRFDVKVSTLFVHRVFSLPAKYFSVRKTGDFLKRLDELGVVREFLLGKPTQLAIQVLSVLFFGAALFFYHPLFVAIILISVPASYFIATFWWSKLKLLMDREFRVGAKVESKYIEFITNRESVVHLGAGIAARWKWQEEFFKLLKLDRQITKDSSKIEAASTVLSQLIEFCILLFAAYLCLKGDLSVGQAIAATIIAAQFIEPLMGILSEWKGFAEIGVSIEKLDEVLLAKSEPAIGHFPTPKLKGQIELRDVGFKFGGESSSDILKNIDLQINPGELVALVGPSGCGKSTLASIISLLHSPSSGQVLLDGQDSSQLDLQGCRKQMATVPQDQVLFPGTILENIAFGDPEPSLERAIEAAELADAHGFISKMDNNYLHEIKSGNEVSGGERQRLVLARAFYGRPQFLILDEATSALDATSERRVLRSIEYLRREYNMTIIVIAHRLDAISKADKIVVFEKGRIVELGDHRSLLKLRGLYYRLFKYQVSA